MSVPAGQRYVEFCYCHVFCIKLSSSTDTLENHFVSMFSLHVHLSCFLCYSLLMASQFYRKFDKIGILATQEKRSILQIDQNSPKPYKWDPERLIRGI